MDEWRIEALKRFPNLRTTINENQLGVIGVWSELYFALDKAYDNHPINEDLIGKIYDFAAWCFRQPNTGNTETDVSNATAVGLIESLALSPRAMDDLHRWMSVETFEGCESLFRYHMSQTEYAKFRTAFLRRKSEYKGPSRL